MDQRTIARPDQPLVSILIPVFNREKEVGEAIRSALAQTWGDIEVIVTDNCSTDSTWTVVDAWVTSDSRVRAFRNNENLGPVRNWEKCMSMARGSTSKILFSDDLLAPDAVEKMLGLMSPDVGFVFSQAIVGENPWNGSVMYRWNRRTGKFCADKYLLATGIADRVPYSPGAALFRTADLRRNLLTELPGTSLDFSRHGAGSDFLLFLLTSVEYPRVGFVAEPLVFFRAHSGSITTSLKSRRAVFEAYYQTKVWFALRFPKRVKRLRYLASAWLSLIGAIGTMVSFDRISRPVYSPSARETSWVYVTAGVIRLCIIPKRIFYRLSDYIYERTTFGR